MEIFILFVAGLHVVLFEINWMKKKKKSSTVINGQGHRASPIWQPAEFSKFNSFQIGQQLSFPNYFTASKLRWPDGLKYDDVQVKDNYVNYLYICIRFKALEHIRKKYFETIVLNCH